MHQYGLATTLHLAVIFSQIQSRYSLISSTYFPPRFQIEAQDDGFTYLMSVLVAALRFPLLFDLRHYS